MKTVSFYSYKGGVGRTLLAAQMARILCAMGKKVVVADFDFDAPGILPVFGLENRRELPGTVDLIEGAKSAVHKEIEYLRKLKKSQIDKIISKHKLTMSVGDLQQLLSEEQAILDDICNKANEFEKNYFRNLNLDESLFDLVNNESLDGNEKIKLTNNGAGWIKLLPCGKTDVDYWKRIHEIRDLEDYDRRDALDDAKVRPIHNWLELLVAEPDKELNSLEYIFREFIKPALENMGVDYLIIDARAGITPYGNVARALSDSVAMIFCPNNEAKFALENLLLDNLNKFQKEKKSLENVAFIVTRMPSETVEMSADASSQNTLTKEKCYEEIKNIINAGFNFEDFKIPIDREIIYRINSDLQLLIDASIRNIDNRFADTSGIADIVQIHEDWLDIFAHLFPEIVVGSSVFKEKYKYIRTEVDRYSALCDMSPKERAEVIWHIIFGRDNFKITYKNLLYSFWMKSGYMRNPADRKRNVALKIETFNRILEGFHQGFTGNSNMFAEMLLNSGYNCGTAFGESIRSLWSHNKNNNIKNSTHWSSSNVDNFDSWCRFDSESGFGLLSCSEAHGKITIRIENPFIIDIEDINDDDSKKSYLSFFNGYVKGVLEKFIDGKIDNIEILYVKDSFTHRIDAKDILM